MVWVVIPPLSQNRQEARYKPYHGETIYSYIYDDIIAIYMFTQIYALL